MQMNNVLHIATGDIAAFLSGILPQVSADWWQNNVQSRLSFQQQRMVLERGHTTLQHLDFAALLRVLDQNWYEVSSRVSLPREARTWVKELQTVRNKWAHLSGESIPPTEVFRDADTLSRLMTILPADPSTLEAIESLKNAALASMVSPLSLHHPSSQKNTSDVPSHKENEIPASANFKIGDLVALRSDSSVLAPVIEVIPGGDECRYVVFQNNGRATYYESQLEAAAAPATVCTALAPTELHALLTSIKILSPSTSDLYSLRSGRIQFVPYQYRPVLKLIRGDRPRLLIADEVGVGKTIEAGLIIKELRARMDISSVLVICPKALVAEKKWLNEMKRFDENFTQLDGPMMRHCLRETQLEGEWPDQYAKSILPFSLFDRDLLYGGAGKKKDGLLSLDPPPKFDLVIVDEAHHIRNSDTLLHHGVRFLCDHAQAVVLLTATPVQLGSEDLFTLLNVLRPDLVLDRPSFLQMAEPNSLINQAIRHCRLSRSGWQNQALTCLNQVSQTEWGRLFLRESPEFQKVYDALQSDEVNEADRVALIKEMEELYTFSHIINRTRRRDIGEFTTRKPETIPVRFTDQQQHLHDTLLGVIGRILARSHGQQNVKFMMTTIRRQAASCLHGLAPLLTDILSGKLSELEVLEASDGDAAFDCNFLESIRAEIEELLAAADTLDPEDPKLQIFTKVLRDKAELPRNKSLVFSTFRHTLGYLYNHLHGLGLRAGLIHGEIAEEVRSDLRHRFSLPTEHADAIDVLLSSEVGCEGLDFQFCDLLINYDLPWNPMRIEQRIGRIDRYGQESDTIAIVNFVTPGTVDADIYDRCLWRIGVFHHAIGGSEEILGAVTQEIHNIAETYMLTADERGERLQQLADNSIRHVQEEQELEVKQSALFGLSIPKDGWCNQIKDADNYWLSPEARSGMVSAYLQARVGDLTEHLLGEKRLKTLRLSQDAREQVLADYRRLRRNNDPVARQWEKWLKGIQPTLSVTFDQDTATDHPGCVLLSIMHPLVRQAARFFETTEPRFFTHDVEREDLSPGIHHFAIYRWAKQGAKPDEILVPIANDQQIEAALFELLQLEGSHSYADVPNSDECNALDALHYRKWTEARGNHLAMNRQVIEHRRQSLEVSHRARCKAIEDQIVRATNDKIRLMKESELGRAIGDFNRRMLELEKAASGGDIRATPVVFGTLSIRRKG
jgi:ATP-dependent helicase HepA